VKRLLALLAGALGLRALLLQRRRKTGAEAESSPVDELREKLAESRAAEVEQTVDAAAPAPQAEVADRRRDVHERARGAIDDLS